VPRKQFAAELAEATAILDGGVADLLAVAGPHRGWAWINKLAHASWNDLVRLSEAPPGRARHWAGAAAFLAAELQSEARAPEGLIDLQRDRLIPLELALLAGRAMPPDTPVQLVAQVRSAMQNTRGFNHRWFDRSD
jgi:hypothetical protein